MSIKTLNIAIILTTFSVLISGDVHGQIINIEERRNLDLDTVQWHEQVHLGVNLIQNSESILSINGGAQLEFVFNNKMLLSVTSAAFVKAGDKNFVNEGFQHIRYNSKINNWSIFEIFGQLQYNEQAFIKLRLLMGTGGRFIVLNKPNKKLFAGLSYMYEYDEEKNNEVHQDSRANSYISFQIQPHENISFSGSGYFQPLFNNIDDHRLTFNTAITFKITEKLSLSTSYRYMVDSRRPNGAPKRLYSLINMLHYSF